jgi:tRNA(Ile)-lysidine synthase
VSLKRPEVRTLSHVTPKVSESSTVHRTFTAAMDRLGPFEPHPALAVAVSGGADSMALAILARDWVCPRGGTLLALVVDHGLRTASNDEARTTIERLKHRGITARILELTNLPPGPALAERARIMRYEVLASACALAGRLHLLLGHHAADQVETLVMRVLRSSQTHGLAGMAALRETAGVRLLRPLLGIAPESLRQFLTESGVAWVDDPSNSDQRALRARLRHRLAAVSTDALPAALAAAGQLRGREENQTASELARRATIRPEGFALLTQGRIGVETLRSLIATIGGTAYKPAPGQLTGLAAHMKPATVAGVRILPAGRLGEGFLILREGAAIGAPIQASHGALWDGRFRLIAPDGVPATATIGKLGDDATRFRRSTSLPSVILRTLPAIRIGEGLAFVPHLGYSCRENDMPINVLFSPAIQAAGAAFVPAA